MLLPWGGDPGLEVSSWHWGEGAARLGELCHQQGHVGLARDNTSRISVSRRESVQGTLSQTEPKLSRYFCTRLQEQLFPQDTTQPCRREEFLVWWLCVPHTFLLFILRKYLASLKGGILCRAFCSVCWGHCDKCLCCHGHSLFSPSTLPMVSGVISCHKTSSPLF